MRWLSNADTLANKCTTHKTHYYEMCDSTKLNIDISAEVALILLIINFTWSSFG